MKNKISLLVVLLTVLTSCATVNIKPSKVPVETNFSSKNSNGLVIGTVTFVHSKKKSPYDSYKFHLTYQSDDVKEVKSNSAYFAVNVNQFNGRFNGELNESKTFPFVLEQKPGTYNFDGLWFFWNGGMITNEYSNLTRFSLPFTVEPSKITYIGNIIVTVENESNPRVEITDELESNISYFKEKYPKIDWDLVTNKCIKNGDHGNGFIKLNH